MRAIVGLSSVVLSPADLKAKVLCLGCALTRELSTGLVKRWQVMGRAFPGTVRIEGRIAARVRFVGFCDFCRSKDFG